MALAIPAAPSAPVTLRMSVAIRSVAIAIPETGLLLLPTRPTILEETVAKKKPKITTINAPKSETGIAGIIHTRSVRTRIAIITILILISCAVRSFDVAPAPEMLFIAPANVLTISGNDLIRLIIPPAANAPAPMYLIYVLQIPLAPLSANISPIETVPG